MTIMIPRATLAALCLTLPAYAGAQTAPPAPHPLADYFVSATAAPKAPDADGFLQRWLLLEPIVKPNRSNTGFTEAYVRAAFAASLPQGPPMAVPRDGETAKIAAAPRWHALDATRFDAKLFNLAQSLGKPVYGVIFWAVTVVDSPREMRGVRLAVGSNSASMWWVNGTEAAGLYGDRRMVMDDMLSRPLTLRKGRNVIRGAVINGPGLSDFCVRLLDANGQPIRDIVTTTK